MLDQPCVPILERKVAVDAAFDAIHARALHWEAADKFYCRLLLCGGVPGIGKSRLLAELPELVVQRAPGPDLREKYSDDNSKVILDALCRRRFVHVRLSFPRCFLGVFIRC